MKINQIYTVSHLRNFSYILEGKDKIYCIDPYDSKQIIDFLGNKNLFAIINTHEHEDHTRGNPDLVKYYNCEVWAHKSTKDKISNVKRYLIDGEEIPLGNNWSMEVMDSPGHTLTNLCLLIKENQRPFAVFSGDTLFNAGVGNCLKGGDPKLLFLTICKIFRDLPDEVKLYPGHEYMEKNLSFSLDVELPNIKSRDLLKRVSGLKMESDFFATNMGTEKDINPFLRLQNPEIRKKLNMQNNTEEEIFITLRKLRDKW